MALLLSTILLLQMHLLLVLLLLLLLLVRHLPLEIWRPCCGFWALGRWLVAPRSSWCWHTWLLLLLSLSHGHLLHAAAQLPVDQLVVAGLLPDLVLDAAVVLVAPVAGLTSRVSCSDNGGLMEHMLWPGLHGLLVLIEEGSALLASVYIRRLA